MKTNRVLIVLMALSLSAFTVSSCSKQEVLKEEQVTLPQIEQQLASNPHFANQQALLQQLLDQQYAKQLRGKSMTAQNRYFADLARLTSSASTTQDGARLTAYLGFSSVSSYMEWRKSFSEETSMLRKTMPALATLSLSRQEMLVSSLVGNKKVSALNSHYSEPIVANRVVFENDRGGDGHGGSGGSGGSGGGGGNGGGQSPFCRMQYDACVGTADANLIMATAACAGGVFVPVIGVPIGVTCEAAAVLAHYHTVMGCTASFRMCN